MNLTMRNQFLLDQIIEMVLIFDETGRIIYANRSAMDKLAYGEAIVGESIAIILPSEFTQKVNHFETELVFGEHVQVLMAYRKNRTCFRIEAKIMDYTEGAERQYLCMFKDVSNEYALEKKIEQVGQDAEAALKVKSEFVANVTHELRTPVNGIQGNVKELIAQEQDPAKLKILNLVNRGCCDMNNIINNILDFSKLEAGKFTLEMRKFNFRNMIDYVKSNHNNKLTEKGLNFFVTISPEIPEEIIGDELRVVQILNNLLSNAAKFTSVGQVTLEVLKTAQKDHRIELFFMVMDTGIGIDKADSDKLFKSFSQVDASISRKYGGTGLGLNICKQLVTLMGGMITVNSEKGRGTTFSFSVWFEVPEGTKVSETVDRTVNPTESFAAVDEMMQYKSAKNTELLEKNLSKLILSVEMDNWEKAEMLTESIRQLTEAAPREIKSAVLRLKMSVQKADYEKTVAAYDKLQNAIEQEEEAKS